MLYVELISSGWRSNPTLSCKQLFLLWRIPAFWDFQRVWRRGDGNRSMESSVSNSRGSWRLRKSSLPFGSLFLTSFSKRVGLCCLGLLSCQITWCSPRWSHTFSFLPPPFSLLPSSDLKRASFSLSLYPCCAPYPICTSPSTLIVSYSASVQMSFFHWDLAKAKLTSLLLLLP